MDGRLALDVSLVTYGSEWLASGGAPEDAPTLAGLSALQYVRGFEVESPRTHVGRTVHGWLGGLATSRVPRLWLVVAQAGHGIGVTEPGEGVWHSSWTHTDGAWDVRYAWTPVPGLVPVRPPVETATTALRASLEEAAAFASRVGETGWASQFTSALHGEDPPYHRDLVPPGWPARALAMAAVSAYAFGGMSSWNDMSLRDEADTADHERIGRALYRATIEAFLAAANA